MESRAEKIKRILTETLNPVEIQIVDDSARHAGHAGAAPGGETHFLVTVVSPLFAGKSRLECHRMIYDPLQPLFREGLHALNIKTLTDKKG